MQNKLMNQDCAEAMLIKAAQLVMNQQLTFEYPDEIADVQVDISPAFMFSSDSERQMWYSGGEQSALESDLKAKLDQQKVYLLRTGTNGYAGHWQIIFFDLEKKGWINYSSERNHYQLTENDALTEDGKRLLTPHAQWGHARGQYAFMVIEASKQNLVHGVNYLYDLRIKGADAALGILYKQHQEFYPQTTVREDKSHQPKAPVAHNLQQKDGLDVHKQKFQQLRTQLESINQHLIDNQGHNPNYQEISKAVIQLNETLASNSQFFLDPTLQNFQAFRQRCQEQISNVESKAKPHQVHPLIGELFKILKGLLELIAAIIYIPECVVQWGTRSGFQHTFFGGSEINTSLKVADFIQKYKDQAQAIEEILNPNQSHQRI